MHGPKEILSLDRARQALVEASTLDDIKSIRDKAEAARQYARSAQLGLEIQNHAAEIKIRAERKAGELLRELSLHGGDRRSKSHDGTLKLDDLGISRNQSSRWQSLATIPDEDFEHHVTGAKDVGRELTTSGLLKLAKRRQAQTVVGGRDAHPSDAAGRFVTSLDALTDWFQCVYADPPWNYQNQGTRAATDNHYPTLTVAELVSLRVESLLAEHAHLHLWVTSSFLPDAFQIIEIWGFEYRSSFVWVKPQIGLGNYWRTAHAILLLGVRGSKPFRDKSLRSWHESDRVGHSRKPEKVRELVELASPGPYLELFGRTRVPGWTVFGNQILD